MSRHLKSRIDVTGGGQPPPARLRGVTIGAGYFGRIQLADWSRLPNARIVGLCLMTLRLQREAGMTVLIDANRYAPSQDNPRTPVTMTVEGANGVLELSSDGSLRLCDETGNWSPHPYRPSREGYLGDSCRACLEHFIDCLRRGTDFETSGTDSLKTLRAVFAAYDSAAQGRCLLLDDNVH